MRERIEKEIETFVYGMLSLVFGMAFFFGVLYPDHGISPGAYSVKDMETEAVTRTEAVMQTETVTQPYDRGRGSLWEEIYYCDRSRIRYRLYFYERLKNS